MKRNRLNARPLIRGDLLGGHTYTPIPEQEEKLERSLTNRHIQLIAIGGAIGTGLFMGSGKTLAVSGTSIVLTYILIGFFFFFIMRAMGELLLSNTNYKSFADFATDYLGPWAGYFLGWSYWFNWITSVIADVVVIGGYSHFWFPDLPVWIPAFSSLLILGVLNLFSVKIFGELEFWFALIKVVAIILFLMVGVYLVSTAFVSPNGVQASIHHLTDKNAMFPFGFSGFIAGFQIAVFAFAGIELIGTTAAETKDPEKTLPKAINTIPFRILLFYVGSLLCIITIMSWSKISPEHSPFVDVFTLIGLPAAASVVNFVVATSAMSSANSGLFSTSRMLYGLSMEKDASPKFKKLSKGKVPVNGVLFSMGVITLGTSLLFIIPNVMTVFTILAAFTSILMVFTFGMILASYLVYRKKRPDLHEKSIYKMPFGLSMSWICLVFLAFIVVVCAFDSDTLVALLFSPVWFIGLLITYKRRVRKDQERAWILKYGKRIDLSKN